MKHDIQIIVLIFIWGVLFWFIFGKKVYGATLDEVVLIAQTTYAEANNQCEDGQRLVIDTVLNRVDDERFPNTIEGVLGQQNQFAKSKKQPPEDIINLVLSEVECRTNDKVLWFRTKRYHTFGTPITQVEDHYFSGKEE